MKKNGLKYSTMIHDIDALMKKERSSNHKKNVFSTSFDYTKYNQWFEVSLQNLFILVLFDKSSSELKIQYKINQHLNMW